MNIKEVAKLDGKALQMQAAKLLQSLTSFADDYSVLIRVPGNYINIPAEVLRQTAHLMETLAASIPEAKKIAAEQAKEKL